MNLGDLRTIFRETSGRYDLTDSLANFYIVSGQSHLDRELDIHNFEKFYLKTIIADDYYIAFPNCRTVRNAWIVNSDGFKYPLERLDFDVLRQKYQSPHSTDSKAIPAYWALAKVKTSPSATNMEITDVVDEDVFNNLIADNIDTLADDQTILDAIALFPVSDGTYSMEVEGSFYSESLVNDEDESIWSNRYPEILIMGAMYWIEVYNRNSEGRNDWEAAIKAELQKIEYDSVDFESYDSIMKG